MGTSSRATRLVLGLALASAKVRCRPVFAASVALIAISIGVQFLGAAVYPSGWNVDPQDIDRAPQRLWDWSDSELSRCIAVSKPYRALFGPRNAKIAPAILDPTRPGGPRISPLARGTLDRIGCAWIEGWAWDPQQPETPIAVDLYDGETLLGTMTADRLRPDLVRKKKGNGKHGFVFHTPASLRDGMVHQIHVKIAGPEFELNKSPCELVCPRPE